MTDLFGDPKPDDDPKSPQISGNKFWRRYPILGRPRAFENPEDMLAKCMEYFDWVDDNPLMEAKVFGTGFKANVDKARPMSQGALCIHIGVSKRSYHVYLARPEFQELMADVQNVIDTYNFEIAVAGLANANIIARQLGLYEKVLHGNDPENPMPEAVTTYELPDNGR